MDGFLTCRLSRRTVQRLREEAAARGLTLSELVRQRLDG